MARNALQILTHFFKVTTKCSEIKTLVRSCVKSLGLNPESLCFFQDTRDPCLPPGTPRTPRPAAGCRMGNHGPPRSPPGTRPQRGLAPPRRRPGGNHGNAADVRQPPGRAWGRGERGSRGAGRSLRGSSGRRGGGPREWGAGILEVAVLRRASSLPPPWAVSTAGCRGDAGLGKAAGDGIVRCAARDARAASGRCGGRWPPGGPLARGSFGGARPGAGRRRGPARGGPRVARMARGGPWFGGRGVRALKAGWTTFAA